MLFTKLITLALPLVALAAPLKDADLVGVSSSLPIRFPDSNVTQNL